MLGLGRGRLIRERHGEGGGWGRGEGWRQIRRADSEQDPGFDPPGPSMASHSIRNYT